jgi:hypothetical protein
MEFKTLLKFIILGYGFGIYKDPFEVIVYWHTPGYSHAKLIFRRWYGK